MNGKLLVQRFLGTAGVQVLGRASALLLSIVLARMLQPEQFGYYSYIISLLSIFSIPVVTGLPNLIIREVARYNADNEINKINGIVRWSEKYIYICFLILASVFLFFMGLDFSYGILAFISLSILLRGITFKNAALLNVFGFVTLSQAFNQLLPGIIQVVLLVAFFLINKSINIEVSLVLYVVSLVVTSFILWIVKRKKITIEKDSNSVSQSKYWLKALVPFSMVGIVYTLNTELSIVIVNHLADPDSVAFIKIALQLSLIVSFGLTAIDTVLRPEVARNYQLNRKDETQKLINKSLMISIAVSLPVLIVLILFGKDIISLLYGEQYRDVYSLLVVLCFGNLVNAMTGSVSLVLNMTGNEKYCLMIASFSLLLNVILMTILVPVYGIIGAAWAIVVSVAISNICMAKIALDKTELKTYVRYNFWRY